MLQCGVNRPPQGSFLNLPEMGRGFSRDEVAAHPKIQGGVGDEIQPQGIRNKLTISRF
jgi:hypothetical protein